MAKRSSASHKALEHDPDCAMAHWGIAYAVGPNYNLPWDRYDPAGKAKALAGVLRRHAGGAGASPDRRRRSSRR